MGSQDIACASGPEEAEEAENGRSVGWNGEAVSQSYCWGKEEYIKGKLRVRVLVLRRCLETPI